MAVESLATTTVLNKIRHLVTSLSAEERFALIQAIADIEPKPEPVAESTVSTSAQRRNRLTVEQAAWYAQPPDERARYRGEFVAVQGGQVVDHDSDQRALYLRVRARFGRAPVPIIHADWVKLPVYTIHSPHLE